MRARSRGFSLLELVTVVVILGVIAAIAIPRVSQFTVSARESALRQNLSIVAGAVERYRVEHGGTVPTSSEQLTMYTNAAGATSATKTGAFIYGPYLLEMPELTMGTNRGQKGIVTGGSPGDSGGAGWWIDDDTGDVRANLPDTDKGANGDILNTIKPGMLGR